VPELLVEDLAHRQGHDDAPGLFEVAADLGEGIRRVVEGNEEPLGAFLAGHHRLESVDVGAARLVLLLHLDGVKLLLEF
jgi:hypothetical protein